MLLNTHVSTGKGSSPADRVSCEQPEPGDAEVDACTCCAQASRTSCSASMAKLARWVPARLAVSSTTELEPGDVDSSAARTSTCGWRSAVLRARPLNCTNQCLLLLFPQGLYKDMVRLFAQLPLAALVEGNTLILHGGLFRTPPEREKGKPKYKNLGALPDGYQLRTGSLDDLRQASKGGADPDPDCECHTAACAHRLLSRSCCARQQTSQQNIAHVAILKLYRGNMWPCNLACND